MNKSLLWLCIFCHYNFNQGAAFLTTTSVRKNYQIFIFYSYTFIPILPSLMAVFKDNMRELLLDAKTLGIIVLVIIFDISWLWTYFRGWKSVWLMFNIFTSHQGGSFFLFNFIFQLNGTWNSVFYLQNKSSIPISSFIVTQANRSPTPFRERQRGSKGRR